MKTQAISNRGALVAALALGFVASQPLSAALSLTTSGPDAPGINNAYELPGGNVTDADIVQALNAISPGLGLTLAGLPDLLYKSTPPNTVEEALDGSYVVSYTEVSGDYESATITYVDGKDYFDTTSLTWLLAKDGVSSYVWNLTGIWDGKETIEINNLWPGNGDFSHISIGGTIGVVPEPATVLAGALLLLPFGLNAVRVMRRNRQA